MHLRRWTAWLAAQLAGARFALTMVSLLLVMTGCAGGRRAPESTAPVTGGEVIGTLVAKQDDRPADGGIDLTLETDRGNRELVRVSSIFIAGPRDSVRAMHEVVDAAKLGDRLRARGARDEDGALRATILELLPR